MTNAPTWISYTCAGGETSFSFPNYIIYDSDDLQVFRNGVLQSLGVDYNLDPSVLPSLISVTPIFFPIAGDIVILNLDIPIVRQIDYQNGNALDGNTLNDDFNRIYEILNQINTGSTSLSPHYLATSNPQDPDDLILPILPPNGYWTKGPSGGGIVAASTIPDPAASVLAAQLLSSDPSLGATLVNTEKNIRVQTLLANTNLRQIVVDGYLVQLTDCSKTLSIINNGDAISLPQINTLPIGWWIQVAFYNATEQGYVTVNASGPDTILLYGTFKLIGANRRFTFSNNGTNWDIIDNDFTEIGKRFDFFYNKPNGEFLFCDGSAVSRSIYNVLFTKLGTTWGAGDGSTTFNIPDSQGRSPVGSGSGSGLSVRVIGPGAGEEATALTGANNGPHTHAQSGIALESSPTGLNDYFNAGAGNRSQNGSAVTASSGSGTPHNTMHPFYVDQTMIKAF